jgi:serine/threonine protein kinase
MACPRVDSPTLATLENLESMGLIGTGTNAYVRKAMFNQQAVAVKIFKKSDARSHRDFLKEVDELTRLRHPNIIRLIAHGKWKENGQQRFNCMILELADVGSLHHVLYETEHAYTTGHAVSWLKQLADAINYLHTQQPKPILHRDLKPLNLLIMNAGRSLKVCDFGTVCNLKTIMSVDKGSPCWMAPEAMQHNNYDQKCDVYSYVIVMWEVFARLLPYFYLPKANSNQIMLGVGKGELRPKRLADWPRVLECLFERGIDADGKRRPSMQIILDIMVKLDSVINDTMSQPGPIVPASRDADTRAHVAHDQDTPQRGDESNAPPPNGLQLAPPNVFFRNQPERYSFGTFGTNGNNNKVITIRSKQSLTSDSSQLSTNTNNNETIDPTSMQAAAAATAAAAAIKAGHRRSKSHGGNDMIMSSSLNANVYAQWKTAIASTVLNPIEPLYGDQQSVFLYNLHKQLVKEDDKLAKEISKMRQQREQLEATVKNVNNYSELVKQKSLLIEENERLRRLLKT